MRVILHHCRDEYGARKVTRLKERAFRFRGARWEIIPDTNPFDIALRRSDNRWAMARTMLAFWENEYPGEFERLYRELRNRARADEKQWKPESLEASASAEGSSTFSCSTALRTVEE